MIAAARNKEHGSDVLRLLLEYDKGVSITDEISQNVCCNIVSGDDIMDLLIDHLKSVDPDLSKRIAVEWKVKVLELSERYYNMWHATGFRSFYLTILHGTSDADSLEDCLEHMFPTWPDLYHSKLEVRSKNLFFPTVSTSGC